MILGLGTDIVNISRIESTIERFGNRFLMRYFTMDEVIGAKRFSKDNVQGYASYFAKRFAAKEAFAKALGTGFRDGLRFVHISISNDAKGKPHIKLSKKALIVLDSMIPEGKTADYHVSLCDDYPTATATVIISCN